MSRIPQSFINELLSHTDIVDVIEKRIALKKNGSRYLAKCPFHNEKTPSFNIDAVKQFYYCFGCHAHGNVISFLMNYDRLDFLDAIDNLAATAGMTIPREENPQAQAHFEKTKTLYPLMDKVAMAYQKALNNSTSSLNYLKSRGLSPKTIEKFRIGFAPEGWDFLSKQLNLDTALKTKLIEAGMLSKKADGSHYDRFRNRIMFPIQNRKGDIIGFGGRTMENDSAKYLNSPETPIFHKGSELYALNHVKKSEQLLVVEGYMDVIVLDQYGIDFAVAPLGTAITKKQIQMLIRTSSHITFCFDGDTAGKKAAWRALEISLPLMQDGLNLNFLFLPQNEDPDSFIRKQGKIAFEKALQNASSLPDFFFKKLSEAFDINDISGKASLSNATKPYLQSLPEGIYKTLMLEKTSTFIGVSADQLIAPTKEKPPAHMPAKKIASKHNKVTTPMRIAISLLLQHPRLSREIPDKDFLNYCTLPGVPLLKQLIELLSQYPDLTTGGILENFREQPKTYGHLIQLVTELDLIPDEGIKEEFLGALNRIQKQAIKETINVLLQKAKRNELSFDEKRMLQQLILAQKTEHITTDTEN